MSFLDDILGRVTESATVADLAAKVGLTPEQIEGAVTALAQAHTQEGDTVQTASDQTGLPQTKLNEIIEHIGGEGSLGRFTSMLGGEGGFSGILGRLGNLTR